MRHDFKLETSSSNKDNPAGKKRHIYKIVPSHHVPRIGEEVEIGSYFAYPFHEVMQVLHEFSTGNIRIILSDQPEDMIDRLINHAGWIEVHS